MGLDIVELFLAVEGKFQIHITDEEASDAFTVGALHQLVVGKLQLTDVQRCLTSVAFYRLRRAFVDVLSVQRRQIRPETPLEPLLPIQRRRALWTAIEHRMALKMPNLHYPRRIDWGLTALCVPAALTPVPFLQTGGYTVPLLLVLPMLGYALAHGLLRLVSQLAVEFPSGIVTVGDLARDVLARNYAVLVESTGGWTSQAVYDVLVDVIVRQTGVDRAQITPEARLLDDLGID
ncbi:MAG: hypothetical protein IPP47_33690 [Bryobacterales bacterium]|nr:hypothetical protein [Bryobacterales bacterium]